MANTDRVRILGWDTVDGTRVPLHARLTVLPGLADDERALLVDRLAATARTPAGELVLRAADLPGAIVPPDLPALDDALHRAQQRQAEEALFAAAAAEADELLRVKEAAAAEAGARLTAIASGIDQRTAALADAQLDAAQRHDERDTLAAAPIPLRPPSAAELGAADDLIERCRVHLAVVEEWRAEAPAELVDALEAAYAAVREAEDRGGVLGRRRLADLRQSEAEAAAAIGTTSYEAWLVRSSSMLPVRDEARIAEARRALAAAETAKTEIVSRDEVAATGRRSELARRQALVVAAEQRADEAAVALAAAVAQQDEARLALAEAEHDRDEARADRDAVDIVRSLRAERREGGEVAVVDLTNVRADALEASLLSLLATHEQVGHPLVIDDAFAGLDDDRRALALDVLAWASDVVQVVYLESGRNVASRVQALGPDAGSIVELHGPA